MSGKAHITVNGNRIQAGTILTARESFGHVPSGYKIRVEVVRHSDGGGVEIGVVSDARVDGWHELDGRCSDGHGYWIEPRHVKKYFKVHENMQVVRGNVSFKQKQLKGMECRVLSHLPQGKVFVELEENVGGASCDGLGKKGHCVVLKKDFIGKAPKTKQKEREV